jgi:flavin-binding protein dodecin
VNWAGEMTSGWDEAVKEAIQKTAKSIEFYQIEELAEIGLILSLLLKV